MIEETATVVSSGAGRAVVETARRAGCSTCATGQGCGAGVLAAWFGRRRIRLDVDDPVGAAPGDRVVLEFDERLLLRAALLVYGMPLAGMLVAVVAGSLVVEERWTLLFAVAGFLAGMSAGGSLARRASTGMAPRVLRRIDTSTGGHIAIDRIGIKPEGV